MFNLHSALCLYSKCWNFYFTLKQFIIVIIIIIIIMMILLLFTVYSGTNLYTGNG